MKEAIVKLLKKLDSNRKIRLLTSPIRLLPSFLIIGFQKCGTTSLFNYLLEHPCIASPQKKELGFFGKRYKPNIYFYRCLFPTLFVKLRNQDMITGEATTGYVCHPHAPRRIAQTIPKVKLILLMRNPVDRAFSHYNHTVRLGKESLSFEDAIVREKERLNGILERMIEDENYYSPKFPYYSYLSGGIYVDKLKAWFDSFNRKQILIIRSEDLYIEPAKVYNRVLDFLGLKQWEIGNYKPYNKGRYQGINPTTRQYLIDYFKPHNERLYKYLGTNFYWY